MDEPRFISDNELFVRVLDGGKHYAERMRLDGTGRRRIVPQPIAETDGVTPDRKWFIGPEIDPSDPSSMTIAAHEIDGSRLVRLCKACLLGWADSTSMYFDFGLAGQQVIAVPTQPGSMFPELPAEGLTSAAQAAKLPGAKISPYMAVRSPSGNMVAFAKHIVQRNIYLIPVKR